MNNISRTLYLGTNLSRRTLLRKYLCQTNQLIRNKSITSAQTNEVAEIKLNEVLSNVEPRIERRKPKIQPFLLEIFAGEFNKELLAFPEILNKEEFQKMKDHLKSIESFAANENITSEDFTTYLKNIKMFGAPATVFSGGLASNTTERCKYLESISHDVQTAIRIKNNWIGLDFVKNGLDEEMANRVIAELVTGKVPIRLLTAESIPTNQTIPEINSTAKANVKGEWVIDGEKIFHGDLSPGYFIVTCSVNHEIVQPFLIHPGAMGIVLKDSSITFKNTPATLLGRQFGMNSTADFIKPTALLKNALSHNRLETAAIAVGLLRNAITAAIKHTRNKFINGAPYTELHLVQNCIAEAVTALYASESMVYFTAGLHDGYTDPETELEMTVCKTFATKRAFDAINGIITVFGLINLPPKLTKCLDDARILLTADEPTYKLNNYVAMCGVQRVGQSISNSVSLGRKPFDNPMFNLKKMFRDLHQRNDNPNLNLRLEENLHPSLRETALLLEYSVLRMKYASDILLYRHGADISSDQRSLDRLAIVASEVYASTASVARASRAYCIGLHMAANELVASSHVSWSTKKLVGELVLEIDNDYILNRDHFRQDIAEKSLKFGTSHYEHSLERVFF